MSNSDVNISPISTAINVSGKNGRKEKSFYSKYTGSSIYEFNLTASNCQPRSSNGELNYNTHLPSIPNKRLNTNTSHGYGNETYQNLLDKHYNQFYKQLSIDTQIEAKITNKQLVSLEDIEGELLSNQKIFIDAYGIKNALRCKRDCLTFFGSVSQYRGKVINDFVLNLNEEIYSEPKYLIFFVIVFDKSLDKFYFKNVQQIDLYTLNQLSLHYILFYSFNKNMKLYNRNLVQYGTRGNLVYIDIMNDNSIKLEFISKTCNVIENSVSLTLKDLPIYLGDNCIVPMKDGKKVLGEIYFNTIKQCWMISDKQGECIWIGCDRRKIIISKKIRIKLGRSIIEMNIDDGI